MAADTLTTLQSALLEDPGVYLGPGVNRSFMVFNSLSFCGPLVTV